MNGVSVLYRLDPRTKLLLVILFSALVFFVDTLPVAAVQMALFVGLCFAAKIPLKKIFPLGKFLPGLILLVIILQVLFGGGLFTGLMIGCRIITLFILMPMLTVTTGAPLLALGITRLGLNYRAAYIITSALNLIPLFEEDVRSILDARRLRGMKSVKPGEYPAIVLPFFFFSMRQAQMSALAMDTRAFGAYGNRTWLNETRMTARDYWAFAAGISWFVIAITANCLLKR
jgi:energy-coupling factor transport system permease protein